MARGRTEGRAEGRAAVILHILDKRGVQLTDQQRRRINTCADLATLASWLDAAIEVDTAAELFG